MAKMKKVLAIAMAAAMGMSMLAGCGGQGKDDVTEATSQAETSEAATSEEKTEEAASEEAEQEKTEVKAGDVLIECLPLTFDLSSTSIRMFGAGLRSRRLGSIIRSCRAAGKIRSIICGGITGETTTSMEVCSSRQTVFWENQRI